MVFKLDYLVSNKLKNKWPNFFKLCLREYKCNFMIQIYRLTTNAVP